MTTLPRPVPSDFADLEIRILGRGKQGYPVEITFSGEQEFPQGYLDPGILPWLRRPSREAEGEELFAQLFHDDRLKTAWAEARGQSRLRRLRLRIDEAAPELHTLPWEALRDAAGGTAESLAADAATPFSRYLAGRWRPGEPVLDRPVRILVAVASPEGLEEYGLSPLDVEAERRILGEALADVEAEQLDLTFLEPPVSLAALDRELRKGYHILHLIAHGAAPKDEPAVVFLADASGRPPGGTEVRDRRVAAVEEGRLAEVLARQGGRLRLVCLSSCHTAARSPTDAFRGVAPALVRAGIPAVLAMQEQIPVETARAFCATFYRRLLAHGLVDLAANEARSSVLSSGLPGAAIPVLFLRLRSGRLLGHRGQIVGRQSDSFWSVLLDNVADGECTPFLGPQVTRGLLPGRAELARALAREHGYPLADRDRLSRVAQFVDTVDRVRLRKNLVRDLCAGFRRRLGKKPESGPRGLSETIAAAGWPEISHELGETEVHRQLAELDLPLYLTTNFDNFLTLALEARGRRVRRETLAWHLPPGRNLAAPYHDFEPPATPQEPVVLHLFGSDEDLLSMVLTEDDHLDFLVRISRDHEHLLATSVGEALARNTLLFLGYRLEDLDLKIILRGLLAQLDLRRWSRYHVAIQLTESEPGTTDHEAVRRYFRKYFGNAQIDVYWGRTEQFVADLHSRWQERRHP